MDPGRRQRIVVQLPPAAGSKNQNEPAGRTARGTDRSLDRRDGERGPRARWDVTAGLSESGIRTQLMLGHLGVTRPAPDAEDPAPPAWGALCRLEQMLRARRDVITARGRRSHADLLEIG
jgi:hypothetical protein